MVLVTAKRSSEVSGNELEAYKANNITFNSPIFCRPILGASSQNGCLPLIDIISLEGVPVHVARQSHKLKKRNNHESLLALLTITANSNCNSKL